MSGSPKFQTVFQRPLVLRSLRIKKGKKLPKKIPTMLLNNKTFLETPFGWEEFNEGDWIVEYPSQMDPQQGFYKVIPAEAFENDFIAPPPGQAAVALIFGPGESPSDVNMSVVGTATGHENPLPPQLLMLDALTERFAGEPPE